MLLVMTEDKQIAAMIKEQMQEQVFIMGRLEHQLQPPGRADALPYPQEADKPEGLSPHV